MQENFQQLCEAIEHKTGRKMQTPSDFRWLTKRVFEHVHETVSATTLMRLWGYRTGVTPRQATLDILARFLGYGDYREFLNKIEERPNPTHPDKGNETAEEVNASVPNEEKCENKASRRIWWMAGLLVLVVAVGAWWLLGKCGGADESLPAGAEDWTCAIRNPQCDADSLDVWTFTHGGRPLEEDGTLAYFMKDFDVNQMVHGLPAGEYELRVKAWHLPCDLEKAGYDYEQSEDKEEGRALSQAEIYAGPFSLRVKNYVSEIGQEAGQYENVLRFVVLDDSVRIGFRSDGNWQHGSRAQADDFRLYLLRKATAEEDYRQMEALRDSAQRQDDARPRLKVGDRIPKKLFGEDVEMIYKYMKNGSLEDLWQGHEAPLPEGWTTDQDASLCLLVHRTDVGRGMGDSDIYLEYRSNEPAKPGLLIGHRAFLKPGTYYFGAIFFAQNEDALSTDVSFAAKGFDDSCQTDRLMDWRCFSITLREAQEVTVGLWAPEGSDVRRAGICKLDVWVAP